MAEAITELEPLVLHTAPAVEFDDERLFRLCQQNQELRIERDSEGNLIIMAPEAGSSGRGSLRVGRILDSWAEQNGEGEAFGSSTGFILPNRSMRSPDAAWVRKERLDQVSDKWDRFLPLCPDFVVELRSPSDPLRTLRRKMEEYIENGAALGWLLDPSDRSVHIYRPGIPPEVLVDQPNVSGEPVLPGFTLDLAKLWPVIESRRNRGL